MLTSLYGSQDLVDCIKAAHLCGWCHHDIRPSNIVIVQGNAARLIDWDAAVEKGTQESELHGANLAYTSSKILKCLKKRNSWSFVPADDIESICYCFIFMLHGSLPWLTIAEISDILKSREKFKSSMYTITMMIFIFCFFTHFFPPSPPRE